jgi:hypothetical protein
VAVLVGVSAGAPADPSAGPTRPGGVAAASGPAAQPAGEGAPVVRREVQQARGPAHLQQLHRNLHALFVVLLAPAVNIWQGEFGTDDKKDDKDKPALSGTWALKGRDLKIEFCEKEVMKLSAHDGALIIKCDYAVEKGRVKAKITSLEGQEDLKEKAKDKLPVGLGFSFRWKVKGPAATLDDVKGDNVELLKSHLEGEYDQEK